MAEPIIQLEGVTKDFGVVRALKGIDFSLLPSEVHVLLGENGAGKSTLVNMLLGALVPDTGRVRINGQPVSRYSPSIARANGINVVLQDFSLVPTLSVAENLFLGRELIRGGFIDRRRTLSRARELMKRFGFDIDVNTEVGSLSRSEQQIVEIGKALVGRPGALLLDEPTASLTNKETQRLFEIVRDLRKESWAILYITHRMDEVRQIGDRVTVMRDGMRVSTHMVDNVTDSGLIHEMVGRELGQIFPDRVSQHETVKEVLRLQNVSSVDGKVRDVSLHVGSGEIVGLGGLVGSGKNEIGRLILGLDPTSSGSYYIGGVTVERTAPRRVLGLGVGFIPEDRRRNALALRRSVEENITMEVVGARPYSPLGFLSLRNLNSLAGKFVHQLDIRPRTHQVEVGHLSGGNQQKVVLGRALSRERVVYVVSEPTAGVDVGSKQQIYTQLRSLTESGSGVLLISSDLEELVGASDRIYVMNSGEITSELTSAGITPEAVIAAAFGRRVAEISTDTYGD